MSKLIERAAEILGQACTDVSGLLDQAKKDEIHAADFLALLLIQRTLESSLKTADIVRAKKPKDSGT